MKCPTCHRPEIELSEQDVKDLLEAEQICINEGMGPELGESYGSAPSSLIARIKAYLEELRRP
jgi:hypothetical protein